MRNPTKSGSDRWRPRLTVELTREQYWGLKNNIDYGLQKLLFSIIVDDVVHMLELYGQNFLAAMFHRQVTYKTYMEEFMKRNPIVRRKVEEENE